MNSIILSSNNIDILGDYLLQVLYSYHSTSKYIDIYSCISYIQNSHSLHNKYFTNKTKLDKYIIQHTKEHISNVIHVFYTSIVIYKCIERIRKRKHKHKRETINSNSLYGESIEDVREPIIYIRSKPQSNKYYAFPCSELHKLITHALLPSHNGYDIVAPIYPKNPWTNEIFTVCQMEYIIYMLSFHSIHCHKIITMFTDSNLNIIRLVDIYGGYIQYVSSLSYIKNLDIQDFKILFKSLWCIMSFKFKTKIVQSFPYNIYTNVPLQNIICKRCILDIPDIQNTLTHIVHTYYFNIHHVPKYTKIHKKLIISLKLDIIDICKTLYPYVFKNKDYYHLHYNKYNLMRFKKPNIFSYPPLELPIVGFTKDCKIIYNCNGTLCILNGQVLETV